MSKKFEEAYKEYLNRQAPDLWGQICDRLDAKQQEGPGEQADKKKTADSMLQKQRIKKKRSRYIRLYGAIAACVAALILSIPVIRIVSSNQKMRQNADAEYAKVENGAIENITEEAAEEAVPAADSSAQTESSVAAETTPATDGVSVVETNEAAVQGNEQTEESADEAAAASEEDGRAVDTMEGDTLAAEAGGTCITLYKDIKVRILTADVQEDGSSYTAEVLESAYEDVFLVGANLSLYAGADKQELLPEKEYTLTLAAGAQEGRYEIVQ